MTNEASARFRQTPARPRSTVRAVEGGLARRPFRGPHVGLRHRAEGGQCRSPQPPAQAAARGGPANGAPSGHVPHQRQPGRNGSVVPGAFGSPAARRHTGDDPQAANKQQANLQKAGNLGVGTPLGGAMTLAGAPASRPSVATRALRIAILAYQAGTRGRSPACRFIPSCSNYALEAVDRFGARKAIPLVLRRLGRCRPGGPFGLDPVPGHSGHDDCQPSSLAAEKRTA